MEIPEKQDIDVNKLMNFVFDYPTPIVYFVRCEEFIKIGSSNGKIMPLRLGELQCGNPYKLDFEAFVLGSQKLEKKFHQDLKKYRTRGEWFKLNKTQVKDFIAGYLKNA